MIKLYRTKNERVHEKLKSLLPARCKIERTENGKPYADGIFFSLTHTADVALIALSDCEIGIDAETMRERPFSSVLKRFTDREQREIEDTADFLTHWVVKEAYIKMIGGTLAHDLKRLEFFGGELYIDGLKADCGIFCSALNGLIFCVCANCKIPQTLNFEII